MVVAGIAAAIGFAVIWLGLAPWWVVVALAAACTIAGAMLVQYPPSPSSPPIRDDISHAEPDSYGPATRELTELIEHPILVIDAKRRVELDNGRARRLLGQHTGGPGTGRASRWDKVGRSV